MNIFSIILARTETLFFGIGSTKNHQSMIIVPNTFNYFCKFSRQRLPLYMLLLYVLALKQIYQIFTSFKNRFFLIFCIRKFTFFLRKHFTIFKKFQVKKIELLILRNIQTNIGIFTGENYLPVKLFVNLNFSPA